MNLRQRFTCRISQILVITLVYFIIAVSIIILYIVNQRWWEDQLMIDLDSGTAEALNYISLCISVFTLIIAPFFAVSVVQRGPYLPTIFMLIVQHTWLCLTVTYLMSGLASLIPSTTPDGQPPPETTKTERGFSPLSIVFLVLACMQIWFIKVLITYPRPESECPMIQVVPTTRANVARTASLPTYAEVAVGLEGSEEVPPSYEEVAKTLKKEMA